MLVVIVRGWCRRVMKSLVDWVRTALVISLSLVEEVKCGGVVGSVWGKMSVNILGDRTSPVVCTRNRALSSNWKKKTGK
jgi:hypothetical protein